MSNALATMGGAKSENLLPVPAKTMRPAAGDARQPGADNPRSRHLSRDQKAAIIVRLMSGGPDNLPIDKLEAGAMTRLVRAMASLRFVDEATTLAVVQEFLSEFDSMALYFKSGLAGAMTMLDKYLSPEVRTRLAGTVDPTAPRDPWLFVSALEADVLRKILVQETPQVCAIALSKIPASLAAQILSSMDPEQANAAAFAALKAERIDQETITYIGNAIEASAAKFADKGALAGTPVDRVGAILNFAPGTAREDLLKSLETANADLAEQVRRVMFTFADIPDRVEIKDVPKLVRAVDNDTLVTALAGAMISEKDAADFILANMSKRLSEQLSDEVKELGDVKPKDADAAMSAVIQGIRQLEATGELTLVSPEE